MAKKCPVLTAYSYGLPRIAAREALSEHGHHLAFWEVIAPVTSLPDLLVGMAALKGDVPVLFNAFRPRCEAFSCSHGLEADERGVVEAILALDGAARTLDGMVFGIGWQDAPASRDTRPHEPASTGSASGPVVHVQFAHRRPLGQDETERHDANRIAEAVTAAMCFDDVAVVLDNFTGIDRGYYFSGGLVDRLYNPLAGAYIVRNLHAALEPGCRIRAARDEHAIRIVELEGAAATLLLPGPDLDPRDLAAVPARGTGLWLDLVSGHAASDRLSGPTLVMA